MVGILYLWTLDDSSNSPDESTRHLLARILYFFSLALLVLNIIGLKAGVFKKENFATRVLIILMKPLFLVNGVTQQLVLVLCLVQFIALREFLRGLTKKATPLVVALLYYFMIVQYFYRTSHRERFSSIQFGKAFLGFSTYNYWLSGALVVLNTYTAHLIAFLLLPYFLSFYHKKQ